MHFTNHVSFCQYGSTKKKISVIDWHVGLPVAVAFAEVGFNVVGFDTNAKRILELKEGHDKHLKLKNVSVVPM